MTITDELIEEIGRIVDAPPVNLTISTENGTEIYSNDKYDEWKHGRGQALLPFLLICVVLFCLVCMIVHSILYGIIALYRMIRKCSRPAEEKEKEGAITISAPKEINDAV